MQTSSTVRPIVIPDRKANQYIDLHQLLALGNKEKDPQTMTGGGGGRKKD